MPKPVDRFYCLPAGVLLICGSDVCTSEGTHLIMIVDCTKTAFFKCTEVQRKFNTNFLGSLNASLFAVPSNSIVKVVQYVACQCSKFQRSKFLRSRASLTVRDLQPAFWTCATTIGGPRLSLSIAATVKVITAHGKQDKHTIPFGFHF